MKEPGHARHNPPRSHRHRFDHGEGADHGAMFGLLDEAVFDAGFDIADAEGAGACAERGICRVVRWQGRGGGNDDVQVNVGKSAPIELDRGAFGVGFETRPVGTRESIEFVMLVVDGLGVVGLKGRAGPEG